MIAIDTNILARFYVDDPSDREAASQRPVARKILVESPSLYVPMTVILELEWVLRAFYRFEAADFVRVVRHLLGLSHVVVGGREQVEIALDWHHEGLDFADALHLAASAHCKKFLSFDSRRFARRAERLALSPPVVVPC